MQNVSPRQPSSFQRTAPIGGEHWASFVPGLKDGDPYLFYVEGTGLSDFKRDPRARLLTFNRLCRPAMNRANNGTSV
jgi:hypothetical protein